MKEKFKPFVYVQLDSELEGRNYDVATVIIREFYRHFVNDSVLIDEDKHPLGVLIKKSVGAVQEVWRTHPLIVKCFQELKQNGVTGNGITFTVKEVKE